MKRLWIFFCGDKLIVTKICSNLESSKDSKSEVVIKIGRNLKKLRAKNHKSADL